MRDVGMRVPWRLHVCMYMSFLDVYMCVHVFVCSCLCGICECGGAMCVCVWGGGWCPWRRQSFDV